MITQKDIERISDLARIELSDKEKDDFPKELDSILSYVSQLEKVDTSGIGSEINPHHNLVNAMRDDGVFSHETAEFTKKLLDESPETKDGFVKVRSIFNKQKRRGVNNPPARL